MKSSFVAQKPQIAPYYHLVFTASNSPGYTMALNISGSIDTYFQEANTLKLISSYSTNTPSSAIISGHLRPKNPNKQEETAVVGLVTGEIEEVMCLDARRVWSHKASESRITEARYINDGRSIVVGDGLGQISIFDSETKKYIFEKIKTNYSEIFDLQFLDNLNVVSCFSIDSRVSFWDLRTMEKVGHRILVNPMKSALFFENNSLIYSSFVKNNGVNQIDIRKIISNEKESDIKIYDCFQRIQALKPLTEGIIGSVFEDNSSILIDQ